MDTQLLRQEAEEELKSILQYWMIHTPDHVHGGFVGKIDHHDRVIPDASKGVVLNARILWSFASAYTLTKNAAYLPPAKRAFDYIVKFFVDARYGGVYWTVDAQGNALNTKKQVYAQAFVIYASAAWYTASGDEKAKDLAIDMYRLVQQHSYDTQCGGYFEAFTRDWKLLGDARLSEKDENEVKTMNTHLHVLEAYSALYKIWPDEHLANYIRELLADFDKHIIDKQSGHLRLFFSDDWSSNDKIISFGHDIEASWLLLEAAENLNDHALTDKYKKIGLLMATAASRGLDNDGGLWYEYDSGHNKMIEEKHWWPQAEALVGFVNAWQISNDNVWLGKAFDSWAFTKKHIIDRPSGEWVWGVDKDYNVMKDEDKVGLWKCPYHNSRACIELMIRLPK